MDNGLLVANAWPHADPTTVLPDELVSEVFRRLDFAGRLAASHVCVSWRSIAVSDRRLWNQYSISLSEHTPRSRAESHAATLAALLARSHPLPFRLTCEYNVIDEIAQLAIDNIARMETLHLGDFASDDALQDLLSLAIPVMKHFSSAHELHGGTPMMISPRWASAPYLERFCLLCQCVWPPDCIFANLRSYTGRLPEGPGLDVPLSQTFPNLSYLSLHHVTQDLIQRVVPLPPSLTTLKLQTSGSRAAIDCTALLCLRPVPILRQLDIDRTMNASCAIEAVRLFEHCVAGPWTLLVAGGLIRIQAPPTDPASSIYSIVCLDRSLSTRIAEIAPLCGRLVALDTKLPQIHNFCAAHSVFPSLASVTISSGDPTDASIANSLRDTPGIQAPVLQSLTLRLDPPVEELAAGFLYRIVHAFHSPRIAEIVVKTNHPNAFEHDEIAAFLARAARLEIRTRAGDPVYVFA